MARAFRMGTPGFLAAKVFADSAILGPIYVLGGWAGHLGRPSGQGGHLQGYRERVEWAAVNELCIESTHQ